jgi:hypothetical protein
MRYLFLLLQLFFFSLAFESSEARSKNVDDFEYDSEDDDKTLVDDEDIEKRDPERERKQQLSEELERHRISYFITLYNLLRFLGQNSYVENSIKAKIDEIVGCILLLIKILERVNSEKKYSGLYLNTDYKETDDTLTENLFEEDSEEKINHSTNGSDQNQSGNGENGTSEETATASTTEESENEEDNESESSQGDDESSEDGETAEEQLATQGTPALGTPAEQPSSQATSTVEAQTSNQSAQSNAAPSIGSLEVESINLSDGSNDSSDGTSWGGILGGVAGGAALGVLGTTLYNSWNNQNGSGKAYNTGNLNANQISGENSVVRGQDTSVDLSDDSMMLSNPQNSNQYGQIDSIKQDSLTQSNLNEEDSVENSDDFDQNSENYQNEELENEENTESEFANNPEDEEIESIENAGDSVPTDLHQQPVSTMYSQTPNNVNLMSQFGVQMPYNTNISQQFSTQTPYNVNPVQQFGMQSPYDVNAVQQFGMQTPYNIGSVQQSEMQIPYNANYLQPTSQERPSSILDNLIDQEKTVIGNNYSTLSQKRQNPFSRSAINQENRAVRGVIKNKNGDIYIKSKKNTGSQQTKMSTIPVRQVKENEPLKMIQDLADNKIHAYHF